MTDRGPTNVAPSEDRVRAVATVTVAFSNDPVARWVFGAPDRFLSHWSRLVDVFAGPAFASATADSVDRDGGVAIWLPPGVDADEEVMAAVLAEGVPADEQDGVFAFLEQMGEFHPTEQHWYLPFIAVDCTRQGHGYGDALLRHGLERCGDTPAYLEATSPRNKALYARHGFSEIGVIQAGSSPPMWPMVRRA